MAVAEVQQSVVVDTKFPTYHFAFGDFLRKEYRFGLDSDRPVCKAFMQGFCPLAERCPDKHYHGSNYNKYVEAWERLFDVADVNDSLICKHWLRGLCKKGTACEFLHEYNLRSMPECTQFARHGTCSNGDDCLYLHSDPALKEPPCAHYERGFCPLGPRCAARHVKQKALCPYYSAGFCPNGRQCSEGGHPVWREKEGMEKPKVKVILSEEEKEKEKQRLIEKMENQREEDNQRFGDRGGRGDRGQRGGRGRKPWVKRGGDRF